MSATYKTKVPVKPIKPYVIRQDDRVVLVAEPMLTSKGRVLLAIDGGLLDWSSAVLLRNWLSDYIGHYEATAKGGVEEVEPQNRSARSRAPRGGS